MTTAIDEGTDVAVPRQRPHQVYATPLPPRVQPPAKYAHLKGDALYQALITDDETWTAERVALESGRAESTVSNWLDNFFKFDRGERPRDDYTFIRPVYVGTVPTWTAGDVRAWLIRTRKMRRDGTFIPHKPKGRPRGIQENAPRPARGSEMAQQAPGVLTTYEELVKPVDDGGKGMPAKAARAVLAERYGVSERAIIRRLQRARDLRAGRPSSH